MSSFLHWKSLDVTVYINPPPLENVSDMFGGTQAEGLRYIELF
jgi:hypothetical protein